MFYAIGGRKMEKEINSLYKRLYKDIFDKYAVWFILALLIIVSSVISPYFLT